MTAAIAKAEETLRVVRILDMPMPDGLNHPDIARLKCYAFEQLGSLVQALVDLMDDWAGDPDLENATGLEDAFENHMAGTDPFAHPETVSEAYGPGCPVSDPDYCITDKDEDDPLDHAELDEGEYGTCASYAIDQQRACYNAYIPSSMIH